MQHGNAPSPYLSIYQSFTVKLYLENKNLNYRTTNYTAQFNEFIGFLYQNSRFRH